MKSIPIRQIGSLLIPPIARSYLLKSQDTDKRASPTAWMDGLRGCAAFAVFNFHFLMAYSDLPLIGFGFDRNHLQLLRLPILRLVHDGATCVNIFFIIAGYVCSAKAMQLMTARRYHDLLQNLAGSVFRRFFRLYLPVMCIMVFSSALAYAGVFERSHRLINAKQLYPGRMTEAGLPRLRSFHLQSWLWLQEVLHLANVWDVNAFYPQHDPHLWTIAYEFRTSLHLYAALLALSRCRPYVRIAALVFLSAVYLYWVHWEGPLFFLGAALAQYDVLRLQKTNPSLSDLSAQVEKNDSLPLISSSSTSSSPGGQQEYTPWLYSFSHHLPNSGVTTTTSKMKSITKQLRRLAYVAAFYLMSYPIGNYKKPSPGYRWINNLIPWWYKRKEKYPKSIGVLLLVYLLTTSYSPSSSSSSSKSTTPSWHYRILISRPAQYLGRIMFALYLVHGPILHAVGYCIPHVVWTWLSGSNSIALTGWRYVFGLSVGWFISLLICLWAADLFTREVDTRCARLIKWLEKAVNDD